MQEQAMEAMPKTTMQEQATEVMPEIAMQEAATVVMPKATVQQQATEVMPKATMQQQATEVMPKAKHPVIGVKRAILCLGLGTIFTVVVAIAFAAGRRKPSSNGGQRLVNTTRGASSADPTSPLTMNPTEKPMTEPSGSPKALPNAPPTTAQTDNPTSVQATSFPGKLTVNQAPTDNPTSVQATYFPGKLTVNQAGLLLSEGLSARVIGKDCRPVKKIKRCLVTCAC